MMEGSNNKINLGDFDVSETTGFADGDILEKLPEYFQPWTNISSRLVDLIENKTVWEHVDKLELLDHKKLNGQAELRLAHLQLSFIVAGYVWQNGPNNPTKGIPKCIAIPFYGVSERLSLPPVICYCDVILWNWRPVDPKAPLTKDNIKPLYLFPGGHETEMFMRVSLGIELAFLPAIQCVLNAMYAAEDSDSSSLTKCLEDVASTLRKMTELLNGYHDVLSASTFFNVLSNFFKGYGPNTPLPEGLLFEGVSDKPIYATSASAAPTSTLPLVDAALGVKHTEVMNQKDAVLTSAFESCLRGLADFRSGHIKIVTKYVVVPANGSVPGIDDLMNFLKGMRNESTGN
ncbi:indoleamine 2,3-dioxygenase 1-like isoform X2 [Argopecten irradians]|uniref:indoleamine 2,3-dioxygenase 1-like isoform X2 n=1 Tax=Argopecten irradians TaxID=31199 RepID=UPI0037129285